MNKSALNKIFLLPNKFRIFGGLLLISGLILSIVRFYYGIKPEFLNLKVFSIYSSFIEEKYFSFTTNNIFEEICGLLILSGLFFIAFSKEKSECDAIQEIRFRSIYNAVFLNLILLVFSFIFIYGLGFVYVLIFNIYLGLILFILIFQYYLFKYRKIFWALKKFYLSNTILLVLIKPPETNW